VLIGSPTFNPIRKIRRAQQHLAWTHLRRPQHLDNGVPYILRIAPVSPLLTIRHPPNSASMPNTVPLSPKLVSNSTDSHPVNIAIHMIFVPLIYATAVLLVGLIAPIPISSNLPPLNLADLLVSVYAVGYILLEPLAGVLMLPFHLGVAYYAHTLPTMFERGDIAKCAGAANVASWIAQFMGHGLAEGRAPALFDNLFQVHPSSHPPLFPRKSQDCNGSARYVWARDTNR
jgi:uncharacterized membrane protein YGL010W